MTSPPVHLVDPSLFTGPYDRALAGALAETGIEVRLWGRPARPGEVRGAVQPAFYRFSEGASGRRLPERLRLGIKGAEHLLGMGRLARRVKADPGIVHVQWLSVPWWDARILGRLARQHPLVVTVHDTAAILALPAGSRDRRAWRQVWSSASAVVVHTREAADRLERAGVAEHRIHVIPHPPLPLPPGLQPTPFRAPVRTLVLFGELKHYKGVDVALEALARTETDEGQRLRLIVAGRPRMAVKDLLRRAAVLDLDQRLEWHLHRLDDRQLARVLGRADAFLLPYRRIDASGVLSLVLALGRPVVASRVGAMAELLSSSSGQLVPPDDPPALARALDELASDAALATRLAARSREIAADLGTWHESALRHRRVYRKACGHQ